MKTIKVSEATGTALDWLVAKAKGIPLEELYVYGRKPYQSLFRRTRDDDGNLDGQYMTGPDLLFSSKWEAGGPIKESHKINITYCNGHVEAVVNGYYGQGPTELIAAMRCYVSSKLGETVEVPEGLV
jgi:hypothetical protein